MRLSEFAVGDFGALHRLSGTFAPRLSVLWGENESGKTTLFNFIRYALFPRKILKDDPCQPLRSSRISGTLSLVMDDGRGVKVTLDGRKNLIKSAGAPAAVMKEDFLPLRGETFDRVFTVRPDDMRLNRLGKEARDRFFSAEAGLGFASLPEFMVRLDRLEEEIYAPAGGAELNKIWAEMKRGALEIEELGARNSVCRELEGVLEEKRAALEKTLEKLKKDRQRLIRLEAVSQARPAWLEARDLEASLALTDRRPAPEGGIARLEALLEKVADMRERLDERQQQSVRETLLRRMWEANPVLSLLTYREVLGELEGETESFKRSDAEISLLGAEVLEKEETLRRDLSAILPEWSEAGLLEADLSLTIDQSARDFQEKFAALSERKGVLSRKAEAEDARLSALQSQAASIRGELESSAPARLEYQKAKELLLDIRNGLFRSDALYWEIRGEKMCADVLEEELAAEGDPPRRRGAFMAKLTLALLLLLSGVFIALGCLAPRVHPYDYYGLAFCVLVALFPVAAVFISIKEHKIQTEQWLLRCSRRKDDINRIQKRILPQRQEMRSIASVIEQKAQILGIRVPSTMDDLDGVADLLENGRRQIRLLEDRKSEEERILLEIEEIAAERKRLAEETAKLNRETEDASAEWRAWLARSRFDPSLLLEYFGSFLSDIRSLRKDLQSLNGLRAKLRRHEEYRAALDARLRALGDTIGLNLEGENLKAVFRSLKEALELKVRIDASLETERLLVLECSDLERELNSAVEDVRDLCQEAGVDGEAAFRVLAEDQKRRGLMEARLTELRCALEGIFGAESCNESEFLTSALVQAGEIEELRIAVASGESAVSALSADCAALERQVIPGPDDRLFSLRQKNEILRARGEKEFRRWITAVMTRYFTERAIECHKRDRQPEITKRSQRIESLMGASNADQAYLALRLAAASYWSQRSESMPVLLDDALTRFDETRQGGIMEALWEVSGEIQVVLFTCHRFTAEMFRARLENEKGFVMVSMPETSGDAGFRLT